MALFGKKQPISRRAFQEPPRFGGRFQKPSRTSPSPPKKVEYTRSKFRELLKGTWKGSRLSQQQRIGLEKESFPWPRYGEYISEGDIKSALQKLRKAEGTAKTSAERESLSRRRKTLEEATGFKGKY